MLNEQKTAVENCEKSRGGVDLFYTNPTFLNGVDNPNDLNEPTFTKEDYDKLDHDTLVEYCIKKDRRIKRLRRTRDNRKAKADIYLEEKQTIAAKAERRKADANYKEQTLTLYKRILEKLVA